MPVINPVGGTFPLPPSGPCDWTIDVSCCSDWNSHSDTVRQRATQYATYVLWALTARQFGSCEVTVRPCGTGCNFYGGWMSWPVWGDAWSSQPWMRPFVSGGQWFNCGCCGVCSCRADCSVWLPGPVASITEVLVDGVVIAPANYRVDDRQWLVGLNGQCWPECQNMNLESPSEGTFEVTYIRGTPLPAAGQIAAGELACEFAKACAGQECGLPENLASLTRQGVEVTMVNPTDITTSGLTGVRNVDLWIRAVNPSGLKQRPRLYSPDVHYPIMRTS